ncbi:MAG: PEGA domain-containing protein [Candidatus Kapabacteria bacterium]|nr:PEGA domain-containing protein [Candidatus Kapabacteria bacterium]
MKKKFYKLQSLILLCALGFLLNSCATIFNSGYKNVNIDSDPEGADVFIDSLHFGKTPTIARLNKKENHYIEVSLNHYKKSSDSVKSKLFAGWFVYDIFFPTNLFIYSIPVPFLIDYLTKNANELDKESVFFRLKRLDPLAQNPDLIAKNADSIPKQTNDSLTKIEEQKIEKKSKYIDPMPQFNLQKYPCYLFLNDSRLIKEVYLTNFKEEYLFFKNAKLTDSIHFSKVEQMVFNGGYRRENGIIAGVGLGLAVGILQTYLNKDKIPGGFGGTNSLYIIAGTTVVGAIIGGIFGAKHQIYQFNFNKKSPEQIKKMIINEMFQDNCEDSISQEPVH